MYNNQFELDIVAVLVKYKEMNVYINPQLVCDILAVLEGDNNDVFKFHDLWQWSEEMQYHADIVNCANANK